MQMDPKHNTRNTLPRFLGAHSKLKLGSSWGLTFSLVQTTSAPRQAWRKVREPVTATVDSSETEYLATLGPSHLEGEMGPRTHSRTCTHACFPYHMHAHGYLTHTHAHMRVDKSSSHTYAYLRVPQTHTLASLRIPSHSQTRHIHTYVQTHVHAFSGTSGPLKHAHIHAYLCPP